MAFGAVATGSIKAQLALRVAGIINFAGSIPAAIPAEARMGMRRVVVAVFDVISVRKVTERQMRITVRRGGQAATSDNASPTRVLKPDT